MFSGPLQTPPFSISSSFQNTIGIFIDKGSSYSNLFQYSCLASPMDRGDWRVRVHEVARVRHDLVTKPPPPPPTGSILQSPKTKILLLVLGYTSTPYSAPPIPCHRCIEKIQGSSTIPQMEQFGRTVPYEGC